MRRFDETDELGRASRRRWVAIPSVLLATALTAAACSSGGPKIDTAAAPGLISQAYSTLFNFADKSVSGKIAVIQGGSSIKGSLADALNSPLASQATGAKVDSSKIASDDVCTKNKVPAPCAQVTYDILGSGGGAILAGQKGFASYASGTWKVAKVTICTLLGLFYSAEGKTGSPPGC